MRRVAAGATLVLAMWCATGVVAWASPGVAYLDQGELELAAGGTAQAFVVNIGEVPAVIHAHLSGFDPGEVEVSPRRTAAVEPGGTASLTLHARPGADGAGELVVVSPGGPTARRGVRIASAAVAPPPAKLEGHTDWLWPWSAGRGLARIQWPEGVALPEAPLPPLSRSGGGLARLSVVAGGVQAQVSSPGAYSGSVKVGADTVELAVTARHPALLPALVLALMLLLASHFDNLQNVALPRARFRWQARMMCEQAQRLQADHAGDVSGAVARITDGRTLVLDRMLLDALEQFDVTRDVAATKTVFEHCGGLIGDFADLLRRRAGLRRPQTLTWQDAKTDQDLAAWKEALADQARTEAREEAERIRNAGLPKSISIEGAEPDLDGCGPGREAGHEPELSWLNASVAQLEKDVRRQDALIRAAGGGIALLLGLQELYFDNPTFGTLGDYLGLLGWSVSLGAGVAVARRLVLRAAN